MPQEQTPGKNSGSGGRDRIRWLHSPWWVPAILALTAVEIAVLQIFDPLGDRAVATVLTQLIAAGAAALILAWFVICSRASRRLRLTALALGLFAPTAFVSLFRVDHLTGNLWLSFSLRFGTSDEQPDVPASDLEKIGAIDLRTTTPEDFPQFLGLDRDVRAAGGRGLERDWAAHPPRLVWRHEVGHGWSGFAVVNGYAVTMEQRGAWELVTCYDVAHGELQWSHPTKTRFATTAAGIGPHATPTIDQGMVYTQGATGRLVCLDGATGRCRWDQDLRELAGVSKEEDERLIAWGRSASPLVAGDLVIVPLGGPADGPPVSLVALNKQTGRPVWRSGTGQISYSSPRLAMLCGDQQVLIVNEDMASGHDLKTGKLLWEQPWPGKSNADASVSQAVPIPPNRVLLSKDYHRGAMLLRLEAEDAATFVPRVVWENTKVLRTKFTNVVLQGDCVYGLSDGILECVRLETGERVWKAGNYGHGQILGVGDLLLVMSEQGKLSLVEARSDRPNSVLATLKVFDDMAWNTMALAGRRLLVRNATEAACYELPVLVSGR